MSTPDEPLLVDGTYDVFIVDATVDDSGATRSVHLDLTVISGPSKGEVVSVAAHGLAGEEFELLGMPGTLVVADGRPEFRLDP